MGNLKLHQTKNGQISSSDDELICCRFEDSKTEPWLGDGYYFWDTLKENAEWWGRVHYKNQYVITTLFCDFDWSICYDLHGNMEILDEFSKFVNTLKKRKLFNETTTVNTVLDFIKKGTDFSKKYKSIRACGYNVNSGIGRYINFTCKEGLPLHPKVQICIFNMDDYNYSIEDTSYSMI